MKEEIKLTKHCSRCKIEKFINEFSKDSKVKSGLRSQCKLCAKKDFQKWSKKNLKYNRERVKDWRKENPVCAKERYDRWAENNQEYRGEYMRTYGKEYQKEVWKKIPKNRVDSIMATAICKALRGKKAGLKWENLTGYTIEDLMTHLESKFESWMTWENYGQWHIDHIKPKSSFNYKRPEDSEFRECWALENLQPLEAIENIKKSNHYV
jgi:hypothetical protein